MCFRNKLNLEIWVLYSQSNIPRMRSYSRKLKSNQCYYALIEEKQLLERGTVSMESTEGKSQITTCVYQTLDC